MSNADSAPDSDVVFLHSPTDDGEGIRVLRARNEQVELGEVRPVKEGKPLLGGELVQLTPRDDAKRAFDVKVMAKIDPPKAEAPAHGPPQVATHAYREGWDRVFGAPSAKPRGGHALN